MQHGFIKSAMVLAAGLIVGWMAPEVRANDLLNPGFENGMTDWFTFGVSAGPTIITTDPHEGAQAVTVDIAGGGGGQVFKRYTGPDYVVGKQLHFSAYVKTTPGTGGTPQVYLSTQVKLSGVFHDSMVHDLRSGAAAATLPTWTRLDGIFTVLSGRTNVADPVPAGDFLALRVVFDTPGMTGTSTLYVDDASLLEVADDIPGNFLNNGSFEYGMTSWVPFAGPEFTATQQPDAGAVHGSFSAHTQWSAAATFRQLIQDVVDPSQTVLVPGRPLLLTAWYKGDYGLQTHTPALVKVFGDQNTVLDSSTFSAYIGPAGDQATWKRLAYLITVPLAGNYKSLRISLNSEASGAAGNADWDDVRLIDFSSTGTELLNNGSFEADLAGWTPYLIPSSVTTAEAVTSTPQAQDGDNFARITYTTQINAMQLIADLTTISSENLADGQMLRFSAWYRAPNLPAGGSVLLTKGFSDSTGNFIEYESSPASLGPKAQWTKLTFEFPYVLDATFSTLRLILNADAPSINGNAGVLEWDNVKLETFIPPSAVRNWELY